VPRVICSKKFSCLGQGPCGYVGSEFYIGGKSIATLCRNLFLAPNH